MIKSMTFSPFMFWCAYFQRNLCQLFKTDTIVTVVEPGFNLGGGPQKDQYTPFVPKRMTHPSSRDLKKYMFLFEQIQTFFQKLKELADI